MKKNPYIQCAEMEESLNRNQRDVLDYYILNYKDDSFGVSELILTIKYIIKNYDGQTRLSDDEIKMFWSQPKDWQL